MIYIKRKDYEALCQSISTEPYDFPPLSFRDELDKHPIMYLGWAIWLSYTLPPPATDEQNKSLEMVQSYIDKNLRIVDEFSEYMHKPDLYKKRG